jgi:ribosome-binding protein aMBF1 (putative translation factor)
MVILGIQNSIIKRYGKQYWKDNKADITPRFQQYNVMRTGEGAKERRRLKRLSLQDHAKNLTNCVEDLRYYRYFSLSELAKKMGIPRSTLYRHRKGLTKNKMLIYETLTKCLKL